MKIYTKTGDDGTTQLFGGDRIAKSHAQVEAYGTVDELNASLGVARSSCDESLQVISDLIYKVQNHLFVIGGQLATLDPKWKSQLPNISNSEIKELEVWIDSADAQLPELKEFVLPGGSLAASHLHMARTICRRAERALVSSEISETQIYIQYLNRLSDTLFMAARLANHLNHVAEITWKKP